MILILKEMATVATRAGTAMVELMIIASHAVSLRWFIAELESTPKDSDLVGGASSPCSDRRESTTRVRLVRRDERDCENLPSRSRPIHNRSLQRHGL